MIGGLKIDFLTRTGCSVFRLVIFSACERSGAWRSLALRLLRRIHLVSRARSVCLNSRSTHAVFWSDICRSRPRRIPRGQITAHVVATQEAGRQTQQDEDGLHPRVQQSIRKQGSAQSTIDGIGKLWTIYNAGPMILSSNAKRFGTFFFVTKWATAFKILVFFFRGTLVTIKGLKSSKMGFLSVVFSIPTIDKPL